MRWSSFPPAMILSLCFRCLSLLPTGIPEANFEGPVCTRSQRRNELVHPVARVSVLPFDSGE